MIALRDAILDFIAQLRTAGIRISVAESLDAMRAVEATEGGIARCTTEDGATSEVIGTSIVYTKPVGSYDSRTSPFNCWPRDAIRRVPKLCREGACMDGPPFSDQVSFNRCFASSIFHATSTLPAGTDSAPNLVVLVQSSLRVIASAMTAPDVIFMSGPEIENLPDPSLS